MTQTQSLTFDDLEELARAWLARTRPRLYPPAREYRPCCLRDCPGVPFASLDLAGQKLSVCFPHFEALSEQPGVAEALLRLAS